MSAPCQPRFELRRRGPVTFDFGQRAPRGAGNTLVAETAIESGTIWQPPCGRFESPTGDQYWNVIRGVMQDELRSAPTRERRVYAPQRIEELISVHPLRPVLDGDHLLGPRVPESTSTDLVKGNIGSSPELISREKKDRSLIELLMVEGTGMDAKEALNELTLIVLSQDLNG
ncbi:unnamed protein product [Cyprideis torosa]|uniref:Uncharacterized protein n=1 Tax=Cyprideis torosa TaxID=163714 RepID=A0A7R8WH32_9CRUS|nr:unnamed protein product [Cyprideis torosa]CAG0896089.1 unnamed protein product [Cyprideis torosa]